MAGFLKAARSVGEEGKQAVEAFVRANNSRDLALLNQVFDAGARGVIFEGDSSFMSLPELLARSAHLAVHKLISAGDRVSCSLEMKSGGRTQFCIGLIEFNWNTRMIDNVRFFLDQGS